MRSTLGLTRRGLVGLALAVGVLLSATVHATPRGFERVEGTSGVDMAGIDFTISPDDRWLFFTKRREGEYRVRLILVNLSTGAKHSFVDPGKGYDPGPLREDCWTTDSRFCVWHAGGISRRNRFTRAPDFVLDVGRTKPTLTVRPPRGAAIWEGPPPSKLTCSDCTDFDGEFIAANLPSSYKYNRQEKKGRARLSRDGRRIFCQENLGRGVALQEFDVRSRSVRRLKTFRSILKTTNHYFGSGGIDQMRESPDGKFLAFLLGTSLKVLDLKKGKVRTVKRSVYGSLHWTTDSRRLFFYSQTNDKKRRRYIYSIGTEDLR